MKLTPEQSQMVEDNIKLAYHAVNLYRKKFDWINPEELESSCYLGLIKAVIGYKPEFGNKFSSYAYPAMYRQVLQDFIRGRKQVEMISIDDLIITQEMLVINESMEDEVIYSMLTEKLMSKLETTRMSKKSKLAVKIHFAEPELSRSEIAARVGCTPNRISWAYGEAKRKLKPLIYAG